MHRPALAVAALVILLAAVGTVAAFAAGVSGAQAEQIESGATLYAAWCASCHGAEAEGGRGPALDQAGLATFHSADRLLRFVRITMPEDNPGVLSEQEYFDIIAFMLAFTGQNPEGLPVDAETAPDIVLN